MPAQGKFTLSTSHGVQQRYSLQPFVLRLATCLFITSACAGTSVASGRIETNGAATAGQTVIDPRGMFFNRFTGSFSGTEWFQTIPIEGTNRYRMADLFSGGFNATIDTNGTIVLDNGIGTGSFNGPDAYIIEPTLSGQPFVFNCSRAPFTDVEFPLSLNSARPTNPLFNGAWINQRQRVDPETGAVTELGTQNLSLLPGGNTLRISDDNGGFFQGVMEDGDTIVFRLVSPEPSDPRFASIPGTTLNLQQNLVGFAHFVSINEFEALFLLQTRQPLGLQAQNIFRYRAQRAQPLPEGDLNGDQSVDGADRDLLLAQLGLTREDDGYNLAADLDLDGDVDQDDVFRFDHPGLVFTTGFELDDLLIYAAQ